MIAPQDAKDPPCIGIITLFSLLDPCPVHTYRYVVFALAGHCTGVATNAFSVVDYKAIFHKMYIYTRVELAVKLHLNSQDLM